MYDPEFDGTESLPSASQNNLPHNCSQGLEAGNQEERETIAILPYCEARFSPECLQKLGSPDLLQPPRVTGKASITASTASGQPPTWLDL